MTDFYTILGIDHQAEADAVAKAYRRSALTYNPECNPDHPDHTGLARRFRLVAQAYVVLSDPKVRAIYDQFGLDCVRHGGTGTAGVPGGIDVDAIDPDAVFRQFFGIDNPFQVIGGISRTRNDAHDFFSASAAVDKAPPKAKEVQVTLELTLDDVFHGNSRRADWTNTHTTAAGAETATPASFLVAVPKGTRAGDSVTLKGRGNTQDGRSQGDVVITFALRPDDRFRREGDDLVLRTPITLTQALCGVAVTVTTIEGKQLPVLIDEIAHPAFRRVIAGEGLPVFGAADGRRGNLIVECAIKFPDYLTAEQKTEIRRILEH